MSGLDRRFDPSEIHPDGGASPSTGDIAKAMVAARELEAFSARDSAGPRVGFEDRVMAAIATEPVPRLLVRSGRAARGGPPMAFLTSVRDAWRLATGGGRPFAVRAQAFAFVLLVVLATGSLTTFAAVGAASLLSSGPSPAPSISTPTVSSAPLSTATPTGLPSPSATPPPASGETMGPNATTNPTDTLEPGDTAEPTETADPGETPKANKTPRPTATPRATKTPKPTETPEETEDPTDDHGGGDDGGDDGGGHGGDDGGSDDSGGD